MKLLAFYFRRSPAALVVAAVLGLFSGLSAAALLAVINHAIQPGTVTAGVAGLFVGLCVLRLASGIGSHVLMIRLSQAALRDLRLALAERSLGARLDHLERVGRARLAAGFGEDVLHVAQVVINVPYFLVNLVVLGGCLIYLGWMSSVVLLGFLTCAAAGVASYLVPVVVANRKLRTARKHEGELFDHFDQALEGAKELKLHEPRKRAFIEQLLEPAADRVRRLNVGGITLYASAANWNRLLFFLYVGLLVWAAPFITGNQIPGVGVGVGVAAYVVVLLYVMAPLEAVMNTMPHLARANVALGQLDDLLNDLTTQADPLPPPPEVPLGTPAASESPSNDTPRGIALRGVSYRYPATTDDEGFVLGPIDLTLRPGECVFIVGGNGAGKTTLLKLLTGLYAPAGSPAPGISGNAHGSDASGGSVSVDGRALDTTQIAGYRNLFSAVFSEFHVFPQLLGHEVERLDERADALLDDLGLRHKVRVEDGQLSTVDLSRGQRKRLALLVAMLEDRPCCVFDEWAADQSPEFRETFYTVIVPRLTAMGKAVVVATHDDRYFHLADRLVKLEEGRLVEVETFSTSAASLGQAGEPITRNNGRSQAKNLGTPASYGASGTSGVSGAWRERNS